MRVEQDPDKQGVFRRLLFFDEGLPARGSRDLDGDGRFEIQEKYVSGRLALLSWDQDGDGNTDYAQELGSKPVMYWDYNDDGVFDSREYEDSRGYTVREFSSKLDGEYDLKSTYH